VKLVLVMVNNLLALSVPDEACSGDGQQSFGFERRKICLNFRTSMEVS
jgi:hypothetical protein